MGWNDIVLASWESKWLDPDYDMATHRYKTYDDEDDEDEFVVHLTSPTQELSS